MPGKQVPLRRANPRRSGRVRYAGFFSEPPRHSSTDGTAGRSRRGRSFCVGTRPESGRIQIDSGVGNGRISDLLKILLAYFTFSWKKELHVVAGDLSGTNDIAGSTRMVAWVDRGA